MVAAILIGIFIIGVFSVMVVLGCCALNVHESDLLDMHPPDDPDHENFPDWDDYIW